MGLCLAFLKQRKLPAEENILSQQRGTSGKERRKKASNHHFLIHCGLEFDRSRRPRGDRQSVRDLSPIARFAPVPLADSAIRFARDATPQLQLPCAEEIELREAGLGRWSNGGPLDGTRLVDVEWDGKTVMMFTLDLRERGTRIDTAEK